MRSLNVKGIVGWEPGAKQSIMGEQFARRVAETRRRSRDVPAPVARARKAREVQQPEKPQKRERGIRARFRGALRRVRGQGGDR